MGTYFLVVQSKDENCIYYDLIDIRQGFEASAVSFSYDRNFSENTVNKIRIDERTDGTI